MKVSSNSISLHSSRGHTGPFTVHEIGHEKARPSTTRSTVPHTYNRSVDMNFPTNPVFSYYLIKSGTTKYKLCDILEVTIEARNVKNERKLYGGDFFYAWIHNDELNASAAADVIIDHSNGTYTVKFRLHWTGQVQITIKLIHSSEAVELLKRIRDDHPARFGYLGFFNVPERKKPVTVPCHITKDMHINPEDQFENMTFCDFTDSKTGFPWFCVKPKQTSCDSYFKHKSINWKEGYVDGFLSREENKLTIMP